MVFRFVPLLVLTLGIVQVIYASEPAPLFTGLDLKSGKQVSLKDYRGKIILLDFWASWCPPCLESLPAYDQLRMDLGTEAFDVISINVDENIQDALDFLEKRPVSFIVISDPQGEIGIPYMVRTLPRTFILDRQGRIVTAFNSFDEDDEIILKATISNLLELPQ